MADTCICAREATVVDDDRRPTPYTLTGCVVGDAEDRVDDVVLRGWSFATVVKRGDIVERWARKDTPDPCPHCGRGNP